MIKFTTQILNGELLECPIKDLNFEDGYRMLPVVHPSWKESKQRLLVVVESVDSLDIRNGSLLSGSSTDSGKPRRKADGSAERSSHNPMLSVLPNILQKTSNMLAPYVASTEEDDDPVKPLKDMAFGCVNFNAQKTRHLTPDKQYPHFAHFADRVLRVIDKLKPTHVLVCGDTATYWLLKKLESSGYGREVDATNSEYKRGWVFGAKYKEHEFLLTPTLDLESLYNPITAYSDDGDDDDAGDSDKYAAGDLLYFVARNILNLFAGKMLHTIEQIKPKPIYVNTMEAFYALMEKLEASKRFALDSETKNLSNYHNAIYFLQFAFSSKAGYVLPVDHPKTPFTPEERRLIKRRLKKFFGNKANRSKCMIPFNGTFDLRILRTQLGLKLVNVTVHEITAGEQLLDENLGLLTRGHKTNLNGSYIKTPYGNLRALCMLYGNDFYFKASFTKEHRNTTGDFDPDNPEVLNYCSMDVQTLMGMARCQYERAEHTYVRRGLEHPLESYLPFFKAHLLNQMSNTVQGISHMEEAGSPVDVEYLQYLMKKDSPLQVAVKEAVATLCAMPTAQTANSKVLANSGKPAGGLFGNQKASFLFDITKREHKEILFFDVLQLPVVNTTSTGLRAIDKGFVAAYKETHPEVTLYEAYTKASKLISTYVKGWYKKIVEEVDSSVSMCLRPGFGFFTIVTGRLNSFRPSLQQIPSRSAAAKYIKRMFRSPKGYLTSKYDYSSHEVRLWAVIAQELKLAASFLIGLNLRRRLILCTDPKEIEEIKAELKKKGDLHIINAHLFFGKWIEKTDPLRDAIKALVFGVIYGKSVKTLARDLRNQRIMELAAKIGKLTRELQSITEALLLEQKSDAKAKLLERRKAINAELPPLKADLTEAEDRDWQEFAQGVFEKLFENFPKGKALLDNAVQQVQQYGQLMSPIGRVRRLWRVFTGRRGVVSAAGRRAQNSPIQGLASETGCSAAFLIMQHAYDWLVDHELPMDQMPLYNRAVHDCNVFQEPYAMVIPMLHIKSFIGTTGIAEWFKEKFNLEWPVIPEIEMEYSGTEDESHKWNWQISEVLTHLRKSLQRQKDLGDFESDEEFEAAWTEILAPWRDKDTREELCSRYPILDVNVNEVIIKALADLDKANKKARGVKHAATA